METLPNFSANSRALRRFRASFFSATVIVTSSLKSEMRAYYTTLPLVWEEA